LIIPAFIYGSLGITSFLLSKIDPAHETLAAKIKKGFTVFSDNFTYTSLLTLVTIYGFIKTQDYYLNQSLNKTL
jgi:mannitol-specific phosphotransferase system IIBC component